MTAPHLNRKLVLQAAVRVADGAGGHTTTWTALGEHWAQIQPGTGAQASGDAGPLSRVPLSVIIRAYPVGAQARPVPGQRFVDGTRTYAVLAVTEFDHSARYLQVTCQEEIAA